VYPKETYLGGNVSKPHLSVIVVVYNIPREAPRTLHSLSAEYQRDIAADDYEVIVVDNGSNPPFDPEILERLSGNFRLIRLDPAPSSPARAINVGLAAARGDSIGVMIDGARMVTPGLLHFARAGVGLYPNAVVSGLGWYLGLDQQRWALEGHYGHAREDALLASIGWPADGYRLFEIAALDETSIDGWFGTIVESNGLFLSRQSWDFMNGVDERFDAPGGGFLNLDILIRACALPDSRLVILLGEGTFHQLHGGIATNARPEAIREAVASWRAQYEAIRGEPWKPPTPPRRTYLGVLPAAVLSHFARAIVEPVGMPPLGHAFDRTTWSIAPSPRPADPTAAALLDLAVSEFRARRFEASAVVARMARHLAPDEPAPQHLLAHAGAWLRGPGTPAPQHEVPFHLARAKAYKLMGDTAAAESEYRASLAFDPDLVEAHIGLSLLRMPGPDYFVWLQRFHEALQPTSYLEIGVARGASIALAGPSTVAIGVDPQPMISFPFKAETHIFCETSDAFFAGGRLPPLLNREPLALAFIDGLHVFAQALKDFMEVEACCSSHSVVLIHDTVPLSEDTQTPVRQRKFYTGDVWKTVLCLKHYRPDLDIVTIATPWTGLTMVTNLDPASRVLRDNFEEAVSRFVDTPYASLDGTLDALLNVVPNDWEAVAARLTAAQILES
jgi:glycosyl transferase family 2/methyltransferase family protein